MSSFKCPCGADTVVKDSRPTMFAGLPSIRRRRWCAACQIRVTTFEIESGALASLWKRRAIVAKALDTLKKAHDALQFLDADAPQQEAAE